MPADIDDWWYPFVIPDVSMLDANSMLTVLLMNSFRKIILVCWFDLELASKHDLLETCRKGGRTIG